MGKISFRDFQELCKLNFEKKYVEGILDAITSSDCLFHPVIVMPNSHIASLYKLRLEIAKETNKIDKDFLSDYEETVVILQKIQSENLAIAALYNEQYGFIVFYEPITKKILGVLKSNNPASLQEMEHQNSEIVDRGFISGFQKYSKGQFVKEWRKHAHNMEFL